MGSKMRDLRLLDALRNASQDVIKYYGNAGDATCGVFRLWSPIDNGEMTVIASAGEGWDHLSVSRRNRCPNWTEMEHVKRMFMRDDAWAFQLHAPPSDHISVHPYCLHIWAPHDAEIPLPPKDHVA